MNEYRVKGTIDEVAGSAKQKVGELTGDSGLQIEGVVQRVKGNIENAWGKAKDAVSEANQEAAVNHDKKIYIVDDKSN